MGDDYEMQILQEKAEENIRAKRPSLSGMQLFWWEG